MSSNNLVICDPEAEYAAKLAVILNGKRELAFQVKICKSPEQIQELLREMHIDILLISEEFREDLAESYKKNISRVIYLLSERNYKDPGENIFKYQSGEEIIGDLVRACQSEEGLFKIRKKDRGKILAFYSPVHRLGQTETALKMGRELSEDRNVLYLNLEMFAGSGGQFPAEEKKNMSVLLYYAKQETGNLGLLLASLVKRKGALDYVPPTGCPEDLREMSPGEWSRLFTGILEESIYDVLLLDIGDGVQGLYEILDLCDEIHMLCADDLAASSKIRQFLESMIRSGYAGTAERVIRHDSGRKTAGKSAGASGPYEGGRR